MAYNFWTGNKAAAQNNMDDQIAALQAQIRQEQNGNGDQAIVDALIAQLNQLKSLRDYYKKQGLLNPDGTLKNIKDTQKQQIDQQYINMRKAQLGEQKNFAMLRGIQEARKAELQGRHVQPGQAVARAEALQRAGANQLGQTIKQERERAYGKAATEAGRRQQYASRLSAQDRQRILDQLRIRLNEQAKKMGWSQQQLQAAQIQLQNSSDGFLQKLLHTGLQIAGAVVGGAIGGPAGAVAGGKAGAAVAGDTVNTSGSTGNVAMA